jgi:hypothetical protein
MEKKIFEIRALPCCEKLQLPQLLIAAISFQARGPLMFGLVIELAT